MCLNPVHIQLKPSFHKFGSSIELPNHAGILRTRFSSERERLLYTTGVYVPCGKCVECMKTRSNDYAQFIERAAEEYGTMFFITLTYDDSHIPISCVSRHIVCDCTNDNEEISYAYKRKLFSSYTPPQRKLPYLRGEYKWIAENCRLQLTERTRKFNSPQRMYDDCEEWFTKSLCRKDVSLWLKRSRVKWERKMGKPCSDFKVFYVGEYGPLTGRPHYHCIFLGMKYDELVFFADDWYKNFGFVDLRKAVVSVKNRAFAAQYVAKYCSKGEFDFPYLSYVEKPFVCISHDLVHPTEKEINHYHGKDILGCDDFEQRVYERKQNWNGTGVPMYKHLSRLFYYDKRKLTRHKFEFKSTGVSSYACRETLEVQLAKARFAFLAKLGFKTDFKPYLSLVKKMYCKYVPTSLQIAFTDIIRTQLVDDYLRTKEEFQAHSSLVSDSDFQDYYKEHLRYEMASRARATWLKRKRFFAESVF